MAGSERIGLTEVTIDMPESPGVGIQAIIVDGHREDKRSSARHTRRAGNGSGKKQVDDHEPCHYDCGKGQQVAVDTDEPGLEVLGGQDQAEVQR